MATAFPYPEERPSYEPPEYEPRGYEPHGYEPQPSYKEVRLYNWISFPYYTSGLQPKFGKNCAGNVFIYIINIMLEHEQGKFIYIPKYYYH